MLSLYPKKTASIKLLALICLALIPHTEQLRFSSVQIPSLVQRNSNFWLSCQFQLDQPPNEDSGANNYDNGSGRSDDDDNNNNSNKPDQLYSVKWYKNNEEFYRLLFNPAPAASYPRDSEPMDQQQASQQFKQQYFAQSGVNVMMGSSNATHVRLLNASLESEGVYACEISTQNLSTIRYEKEIRVYALPNSRLNIIGFKKRYSLGDSVALICATDFSRPKPALAWFINGQRITTANRSLFELELQSKSKLNEPTLFRLTLSLKFKLRPELFSWLHLQQHQHQQLRNQSAGRADGHSAQIASGGGGAIHQRLPPASNTYQQLQPLELQCRYKLTEVSEVTYNELSAARHSQQAPLPAKADRKPVSGRSRWMGASPTALGRQSPSSGVGESRGRAAQGFYDDDPSSALALPQRVSKRADQQVIQGRSPAPARDLWRLVFEPAVSRGAMDACKLGALALLPDDPLIVEPELGDDRQRDPAKEVADDDELQPPEDGELRPVELDNEAETARRRRRRKRRWATIGDTIKVNCSTISALQDTATMMTQPTRIAASHEWATDKRPTTTFCSDLSTRRRLAISGHSQTATLNSVASGGGLADGPGAGSGGQVTITTTTNQRSRAAGRTKEHTTSLAGRGSHAFAYLALGSALGDINNNSGNSGSQVHGETNSYNGAIATTTAITSADSADFGGGLAGVRPGQPQVAAVDSSGVALLAPPLLEWFINNQEAPRASASYAPELPLLVPSGRRALGGTTSGSELDDEYGETSAAMPPPPSIDYAEYFANFDARPIKQHLMLRLTLDKRHFATPDSRLKLRCSSTQAQVLAIDSASATILPSSHELPHHSLQAWQKQSSQQHSLRQAASVSGLTNSGGSGRSCANLRSFPVLDRPLMLVQLFAATMFVAVLSLRHATLIYVCDH